MRSNSRSKLESRSVEPGRAWARERARAQSGFTLIEVLIAIVLLVIISLSIYQATTSTYRLRDTLLHEGDFYNSIRLTMGIVERDLNVLFTPALLLPPKLPGAGTAPGAAPPASGSNPTGAGAAAALPEVPSTLYWGPYIDSSGVRAMRFVGKETEMSFVSAGHMRVFKNAQESEFVKVRYALQDDPRPPEGVDTPTGRLWLKTVSPNVFTDDDDKDRLQKKYPLLRGIQSLKIEYCSREKDQCYPTWDSDTADFRDVYPDRIQITLEVAGPSRLRFAGTYRFRPEVPFGGFDETF